jgi:hypothetical protein
MNPNSVASFILLLSNCCVESQYTAALKHNRMKRLKITWNAEGKAKHKPTRSVDATNAWPLQPKLNAA